MGTDTAPIPPVYTDGLGELVLAYRRYCGVSQRTFGDRVGIKEKSLSDIEIGRRPCPPGLVDTICRVIDDFDDAVEAVIDESERIGASDTYTVSMEVGGPEVSEWARAVIGRAAVLSGRIVPTLAGEFSRGAAP